jgi:hypothetical protein
VSRTTPLKAHAPYRRKDGQGLRTESPTSSDRRSETPITEAPGENPFRPGLRSTAPSTGGPRADGGPRLLSPSRCTIRSNVQPAALDAAERPMRGIIQGSATFAPAIVFHRCGNWDAKAADLARSRMRRNAGWPQSCRETRAQAGRECCHSRRRLTPAYIRLLFVYMHYCHCEFRHGRYHADLR